jgi:hypothetical protein
LKSELTAFQLYEPPRPLRALRHAALVCRSFYVASIKYLFEHIFLHPLKVNEKVNEITALGLEETVRRYVRCVTVPLWHGIPNMEAMPIFEEFLRSLPHLELLRWV